MAELPAGWYPVTDDQALQEELRRECGPGHPLFGQDVVPIARREDRDDVLFRLGHDDGAVAQVHLTWTGAVEPPPWPTTKVFDTVAAWTEHVAVAAD